MSSNKWITPYKPKTDNETKKSIDRIVSNLAQHGRCITNEGKVVRTFSRRMVEPIRQEKIIFSRNENQRKSVVVISPEFELVRSKYKIKFKRKP